MEERTDRVRYRQMAKTGGLGRGLSALIPDEPQVSEEKKSDEDVRMLDVSRIRRNEEQPRSTFEQEALAELSESIRKVGILQPLIVMPDGKEYKVVAGERRLRASIMAGLKQVPVIIREFDERSLLEAALIENIQREDLSDVECARAYKRLSEEFSLTQEEIADSVGKSRSSVANTMRLLSLPEDVLDLLSEKKITAGHARAVLSLDNRDDMSAFAKLIVDRALSVRDAEKLCRSFSEEKKKKEPVRKAGYITQFEEEMSQALGSKVVINVKPRGGSIRIDYYSNEDLERIINVIKEVK